jgi:hypothetical protein
MMREAVPVWSVARAARSIQPPVVFCEPVLAGRGQLVDETGSLTGLVSESSARCGLVSLQRRPGSNRWLLLRPPRVGVRS